jgi:hypothetical protein
VLREAAAWSCARPWPSVSCSFVCLHQSYLTHRRNERFTTFLFPVTSNAADITALMNPVMDSIYIGTEPVSSLTGLNDQLNRLFEVS